MLRAARLAKQVSLSDCSSLVVPCLSQLASVNLSVEAWTHVRSINDCCQASFNQTPGSHLASAARRVATRIRLGKPHARGARPASTMHGRATPTAIGAAAESIA